MGWSFGQNVGSCNNFQEVVDNPSDTYGDGNGSFNKINNDKPGSAPLVGVPRAIEQGADVSLSPPGHVHHQHPCTSGYSD